MTGIYPTGGFTNEVVPSVNIKDTYFIPNWLQDALDANNVTADILGDCEKLSSILTVEDVKFYNSQISLIGQISSRIGLVQGLEPVFIYPHPTAMAECPEPTNPLYENTVSVIDAVSPFIREASDDANKNVLSALYLILNFSLQRDKVFVSFGLGDQNTAIDKNQQAYEDLATFLIREQGIKVTASTQVFKKILECRRS